MREQCGSVQVAALDSMNFWIEKTRDSLVQTIGVVDMVLMNDAELRMLTEEPNLVRAAAAVRAMGPRVVIAKQGEYGAALFTEDGFFALPAYPLETVRDPTGAGDSFAGGLMGYLDSQGGATDDADAAPRDGLRLDARLVLGRGIRLRAGGAASRATRSTTATSSSSASRRSTPFRRPSAAASRTERLSDSGVAQSGPTSTTRARTRP